MIASGDELKGARAVRISHSRKTVDAEDKPAGAGPSVSAGDLSTADGDVELAVLLDREPGRVEVLLVARSGVSAVAGCTVADVQITVANPSATAVVVASRRKV